MELLVDLGGGKSDRDVLYFVTSGGLAAPVNGEVEGRKVVAIDTGKF